MRPVPTRARRANRGRAAALALVGIGLVAFGFAGALRGGGDPELDRRLQDLRVLPVPPPPPLRKLLAAAPKVTRRDVRRQLPRPVRIVIPAIGVSAPVIKLGLNPDGTVEVPETTSETGWFEPGPEPGETGGALIVGHVDSVDGPGVFYHLRALRRGDRFTVVLATGRRLRFVVTSSREVPKVRFPTKLVFRQTRRATLRLVTCGGRFDPSTRHYVDNHLVFAWLIGRP